MAIIFIPEIIRSNRKTLAIQVLPDASVIVKAPIIIPDFFINRFIDKNRGWIEKKIQSINKQKLISKLNYEESGKITFLGEEYTVKFVTDSKIYLKDNDILVPDAVKFRIKKELKSWLIIQARKIISKQVEYYADKMNASYKDIKLSDTKSQWGRCTYDNKLQFSWRLVMAPLLVINYVVVHELAHTFEKNHSRAFWNKVRYYNPSFKLQIKWLRENGHSLKD